MAPTPTLSEPSKTLTLPIGAASPLWLAFAGAASAGVAFWWMTRWTRAARGEAEAPAQLEPPVVEPLIVETPAEITAAAEPVVEKIAATPAPVLETVAEAIKPVAAPKPATLKAAKPKLVEAKAPAVVLAKAQKPAKAKPAARKTPAKAAAKRG